MHPRPRLIPNANFLSSLFYYTLGASFEGVSIVFNDINLEFMLFKAFNLAKQPLAVSKAVVLAASVTQKCNSTHLQATVKRSQGFGSDWMKFLPQTL